MHPVPSETSQWWILMRKDSGFRVQSHLRVCEFFFSLGKKYNYTSFFFYLFINYNYVQVGAIDFSTDHINISEYFVFWYTMIETKEWLLNLHVFDVSN